MVQPSQSYKPQEAIASSMGYCCSAHSFQSNFPQTNWIFQETKHQDLLDFEHSDFQKGIFLPGNLGTKNRLKIDHEEDINNCGFSPGGIRWHTRFRRFALLRHFAASLFQLYMQYCQLVLSSDTPV